MALYKRVHFNQSLQMPQDPTLIWKCDICFLLFAKIFTAAAKLKALASTSLTLVHKVDRVLMAFQNQFRI